MLESSYQETILVISLSFETHIKIHLHFTSFLFPTYLSYTPSCPHYSGSASQGSSLFQVFLRPLLPVHILHTGQLRGQNLLSRIKSRLWCCQSSFSFPILSFPRGFFAWPYCSGTCSVDQLSLKIQEDSEILLPLPPSCALMPSFKWS